MRLTDQELTELQRTALAEFVQGRADLLTEALTTKLHNQQLMLNRLDQEINDLTSDLKYSREANDEHYKTIDRLRAELRTVAIRPATNQAWDSKVSFIKLLRLRFELGLKEAKDLAELPREEFWHKVDGDLLPLRKP